MMTNFLEYKCEFCNVTQSTKGNLDRHQKTSKKCIRIQESKGVSTNKIPKCKYCKNDFHSTRLSEHENICTLKPPINLNNSSSTNTNTTGDNNTISTVNNLDNSTNNITVNNINNITLDFGKFFTDQKMAEIFQEYKSEHAIEQMKGLAKFVIEKVLLLEESPGYYVKDAKRNIYAYETENGLKKDENGEFLRKKIKDGASDHINELVDKLITQYSAMTGKKNETKIEDMKSFKKDIKELHITPKLVNSIKSSYTCKNKEDRSERILNIKDSETKNKAKEDELLRLKKIEEERQNKIKKCKFNIDKDRKDHVLSKGSQNEPLSFDDKPILEELGLKYSDFFLEELM